MDVTHIVEDPPDGLVTFQNLVGEKTASNDASLSFESGGNMRGVVSTPLCLEGTGAKNVVKVVVRIVTFFPAIDTIVVGIIERSKIRRLGGTDT